MYEAVEAAAKADLVSAMTIADKQERELRVDELKESVLEKVAPQFEGREKEIGAAFRSVNKQVVRERVLRDKVRIDGRGLADIRPLHAEVDVIPRVHGSALFERGETQILGVTTLDMLKMEQQLDTLSPEKHRRYMHKYVFPPFSTGETGRVGSPKRREVGHGALARRALLPVLPTREEFPYAIRQLSEAMGSNGSTSMGSVCASTMSLLQAGVPLRAAVAGIAMGLISGEVDGQTQYVALTDILGAEDAFGDMDFKVAGTKEFVTALQLDTKLDGIPAEVLGAALTQARDARQTILEVMGEAIDGPEEMSLYAPRIISIKVPVDKIGEVIGPKGKVINQIQDDTGASLSIEDDGTVYIGASNGEAAEAARAAVNAIANPTMPEVGERYLGTVVKTTNFGAFVSLLPGKDGLLHITKLRALVGGKRVENVDDVVSVGQKIQVQIAEIDDRGKLSLVPVVEDSSEPAGDAADDTGRHRRRRGCGRRVTHVVPATTGRQPAAGRSSVSQSGTTRTLIREDGGVIRRTVLPSGLRVITERVPGQRSATIGVWVGVGSRDESPALHGCSHFLEHLLFKGTEERSALDISIALDAVGGEFNAFTAKEYTCFHARVLDADLPLAVDVLGDMVTGSLITRRGRRGRARRDPRRDRHARRRPRRRGAQPVRRPGLGRLPARPPDRGHGRVDRGDEPRAGASASTSATTAPSRWSSPSPATSTTRRPCAGCARPSAGTASSTAPPSRCSAARWREARRVGAGVVEATRQFEQVNVVLGVNGLTRSDPRRFALGVLNAALGGGTSSRLFQEVREKRGLAYSVFSFASQHADAGLVGVSVGCLPSKLDQVLAGRPRRARQDRRDRHRRTRS